MRFFKFTFNAVRIFEEHLYSHFWLQGTGMIKGGKAMLSGVNCQRLGEKLAERFGNCLG